MRENTLAAARLLGYVQVQIGSKAVSIPVQAVHFKGNDQNEAGGFFEDKGKLGILVDGDASDRDVQAQIARGSQEAVKRLSRIYLN